MPKPKPLATRIALVTGAAGGIGKATAKRLAAEGACVVIADLDLGRPRPPPPRSAARDVAIGVAADVRDEDAVQAMVDAAVLAFGGLDLVVNNAGLSLSKSLLETTAADWDLQHNVMAKGSFLVSKAAARVLIDQGMGGDIVYISSKNSIFAGPNNIAYSATKADQAHQVRLLAAELGEHGVKVNGVNPDGVVQGSGIFAGGWGANRAAVYGVEEKDLGKFYAQRTILKREVLPGEHRQRGVRALRPRPDAHHRPAHPGRRGRGGGLPAMTGPSVRGRRRRPRAPPRGRVMVGRVGPDTLTLEEVHRFPNGPVDVRRLAALGRARPASRGARRAAAGGRAAGRSTGSASTPGRSTTACSTRRSELLGNPFAYRDTRTDGVAGAGAEQGRRA